MSLLKRQPAGMPAFLLIQAGQFISIVGTGMTRFALTLFAWETTHEATAIALMAFFSFLPVILLSPIAGALVDRWNRKLTMMLSDLGAGSMTIFLLVMSVSGNLQIWHIYLGAFVAGAFEAFQFPAYSSAISVMLTKDNYARASAIEGVVQSMGGIIAPILAGVFFGIIGINGIFVIDIVTFTFAIGALLWVFIPQPTPTDPVKRNSLLKDSLFGFSYIWARPSLFGVQMIFFFGNLLHSIGGNLTSPMILARTGSDAQALSIVNAVSAVGGVAGGLFLTWWGGTKRKINGVVSMWMISSIFGLVLLGLGKTPLVWALCGFVTLFTFPTLNGSNQALWMSKVPPQLQGRVFSIRRLLAQVVGPLGIFIAGPLADKVFEPAMQANGSLAPLLGGVFGTGPGAGMAVIMVVTGILCIITTTMAYMLPMIRHVETIIPDFDAEIQTDTAPQTA